MKAAKIFIGLLILALGLTLIGLTVWQAIASHNWNWFWLSALSTIFVLAGYEIIVGGSVKHALKEIFSALFYWS